MKTLHKIILSIIILFLLTVTTFGQNKQGEIKNIKEQFKKINQDTTYSILTLNNKEFLEQMTDGGGELKGYFKKKTLSKVFERIGLSYGVLTTEYYFNYGKLIFVYEKEDDFPYVESTGTLDYSKTETSFEGRYYFVKNKLIESNIKGKKRISEKTDFDTLKKEKELLLSAENRFKLLTKNIK